MPPMMAITYLLMRLYPIVWAFSIISKYAFGLSFYNDNLFAAFLAVLTFWSIMFTNHFKYLRLYDKILTLMAPVYFIVLTIDKLTINYLVDITFNPLFGVGVALSVALTFYLDSFVD